MYSIASYNTEVILPYKDSVTFPDSLMISLDAFSHKRPKIGGSTKSTVYLTVTKGNISAQIYLSRHGVEGKTPEEDGLTEQKRLPPVKWKGYLIRMKELSYNKSVTLLIEKN